MKDRCVVIPAIKKNAIIPDQLVKKLGGVTLMERAINTARACLPAKDIHVLTDSEEIGLICERAGVNFQRNAALRFKSMDIVGEMRDFLQILAQDYGNAIILRPSCPLLTWLDLENAWKKFIKTAADCLISVKTVRQRLWQTHGDTLEGLLLEENGSDKAKTYVVETRALFMLNLDFLRPCRCAAKAKTIPYFLDDHGLEIENYQDWWICERLLQRRHLVFVIAGFPAIGMGHVYRALMLAHEISDHKITFVCTAQSALAAESVAARDYRVIRQGTEPLARTVSALAPDLVINDFLNTPADYMAELAAQKIPCVNFEDMGKGANLARLVINAVDESGQDTSRILRGPAWFCLRDEFALAARNPLRDAVSVLLITFGGTDQHDFTSRVLKIVEPICRGLGIAIRIVAGPGYAHREKLEKLLTGMENPLISFTWATNIMSKMMEGADLAICSAGRTVYELAHMRVPAIVFATHEREATHGFARLRNGFAFGGLMQKCGDARIRNLFLAMLKQKRRAICWQRQNRLSFAGNKEKVVALILEQLENAAP